MNTPITPETLLHQLKWRYATKLFDSSKKIPNDIAHALAESLRLSPSSFGLQPWKFIIITDQSVKQELLPHSWNQAQIVDCSHLVVHCAKKTVDDAYIHRFIEAMAEDRGVQPSELKEYEQVMQNSLRNKLDAEIAEWTKRQVYISSGMLLLAAAELQVDACPMEGFVPSEYDKVLKLEDTDYTAQVVTALGYRHPDDAYADAEKVRFNTDEVIQFV